MATLSNDEMTPGRIERYARARRLVRQITEHLRSGGTILLETYLKAWCYEPKHADLFRAAPDGAFVKRGTHWDSIDYCRVTRYRPAEPMAVLEVRRSDAAKARRRRYYLQLVSQGGAAKLPGAWATREQAMAAAREKARAIGHCTVKLFIG